MRDIIGTSFTAEAGGGGGEAGDVGLPVRAIAE